MNTTTAVAETKIIDLNDFLSCDSTPQTLLEWLTPQLEHHGLKTNLLIIKISAELDDKTINRIFPLFAREITRRFLNWTVILDISAAPGVVEKLQACLRRNDAFILAYRQKPGQPGSLLLCGRYPPFARETLDLIRRGIANTTTKVADNIGVPKSKIDLAILDLIHHRLIQRKSTGLLVSRVPVSLAAHF